MKNIYERYGYYLKYINKIGRMPLRDRPTISSLELDRGTVQMGYREMADLGYEDNLVSYISWVSFVFLLELWADWVINSGKTIHRDQIDHLYRLINDRPIDAINSLRVHSRFSKRETRVAPCLDVLLVGERADKHVGALIYAVFAQTRDELRKYELGEEGVGPRKVRATEVIRFHDSIQAVTPIVQHSSGGNRTDQPTEPSALKASRVGRSEASPEEAPSGLSQQAKRRGTPPRRAPSGVSSKIESVEASIRSSNVKAYKLLKREKSKRVPTSQESPHGTKPASGDTDAQVSPRKF